jgi:hypothetical protein
MDAISAQRTLVKSPPELWSRLSDAEALARQLGEFGEIRITRLEAERTVVWEGDRARGTVELEPSGWGTKVTLTAESVGSEVAEADTPPGPDGDDGDGDGDGDHRLSPDALEFTVESAALEVPLPDPAPDPDPGPPPDRAPEPWPEPEPPPHRKPRLFARLFGRRRRAETPPKASRDESRLDPTLPAELGTPATVAGQRAVSHDPPLPAESRPEPIEVAPEPPEDPVPPFVDAVGSEPDDEPEKTAAILETVLDDLGAAHHRPFSRG